MWQDSDKLCAWNNTEICFCGVGDKELCLARYGGSRCFCAGGCGGWAVVVVDYNTTSEYKAWCGLVWYGMWSGVVWYGMWCGVVWCGMLWCGMLWYGVVWHVVWCGMAWGVVWCGVVWHVRMV